MLTIKKNNFLECGSENITACSKQSLQKIHIGRNRRPLTIPSSVACPVGKPFELPMAFLIYSACVIIRWECRGHDNDMTHQSPTSQVEMNAPTNPKQSWILFGSKHGTKSDLGAASSRQFLRVAAFVSWSFSPIVPLSLCLRLLAFKWFTVIYSIYIHVKYIIYRLYRHRMA